MIPIFLVAVIVAVAQGGGSVSSLQVCGTPNQVDLGSENTGSRIVGGEVCTDCQWMASLKISDTANSVRFCGGTIIRPTWILTAAHCFDSTTKPEDVKIRVGPPNPSSAGKMCSAKKIIIHERYRSLEYNIALIRLSEQITFDEKIKPLTLINKRLPVGSIVSVSGWGTTISIIPLFENFISTRNGDHYRHAKLKLVECKRHFGTLENVICAYAKEESICFGDMGGPLYDAKTLQLVGVINCVEYMDCTGHGLFADVFHLSDWIEREIGKSEEPETTEKPDTPSTPPDSGSSYRPLLVCWLFTLLHLLHLFYIRLC